jgi:hypothetical protein
VWENSIECCATRKYIQGRKAFMEKKNELFFANKNSRKQGEKKN